MPGGSKVPCALAGACGPGECSDAAAARGVYLLGPFQVGGSSVTLPGANPGEVKTVWHRWSTVSLPHAPWHSGSPSVVLEVSRQAGTEQAPVSTLYPGVTRASPPRTVPGEVEVLRTAVSLCLRSMTGATALGSATTPGSRLQGAVAALPRWQAPVSAREHRSPSADLATVGGANNGHEQLGVDDVVDDPVATSTDTPRRALPDQLSGAVRPRILSQSLYGAEYPVARGTGNLSYLTRRSRSELDPVAHEVRLARSSSSDTRVPSSFALASR